MPYIALDPSLAQAAPTTTLGAPKTSVGETLASFQADLQTMLAQRADVLQNPARQKKWINQGYRHLCGMLSLPETKGSLNFSLVSGQPLYMLPTSTDGKYQVVERIRQPLSVVDDVNYFEGGRPLIPMGEAYFYGLPDLDDEPTRYLRYGDLLAFWPTPTSARTLIMNVQVNPWDLVNATDSPIIPQKWHEGILLAARWRAFRDLRDHAEAAIAKNDMLDVVRPLEDREAEEMASMPSTMRPVRTIRDMLRRTR